MAPTAASQIFSLGRLSHVPIPVLLVVVVDPGFDPDPPFPPDDPLEDEPSDEEPDEPLLLDELPICSLANAGFTC
jgi:hypothetical protein